MEDFPHITNSDEYIGFIYGMISANHDIETMFIDGILKHADVSLGNLPVFINRLKKISDMFDIEFIVSLSAEKEEMIGVDFTGCEILNWILSDGSAWHCHFFRGNNYNCISAACIAYGIWFFVGDNKEKAEKWKR